MYEHTVLLVSSAKSSFPVLHTGHNNSFIAFFLSSQIGKGGHIDRLCLPVHLTQDFSVHELSLIVVFTDKYFHIIAYLVVAVILHCGIGA